MNRMSLMVKISHVGWIMLRNIPLQFLAEKFNKSNALHSLQKRYLQWAKATTEIFNLKLECVGLEHCNTAPDRAIVVMSNHQSQLDIPVLVHCLQRPLGFVAKIELTKIPLLNHWMHRLGCVFIDRSKRSQAHEILTEAARSMGKRTLVIFPEGTRSKTGFLLPPKPGSARLALLAKALVFPARIEGTRNGAENSSQTKGEIPVRVTFFPSIDLSDWDDSRASCEKLVTQVDAYWRSV